MDKAKLTEEEAEELRQKAINNAISKFNWSLEQAENVLGRNHKEFLQRVNLVDTM